MLAAPIPRGVARTVPVAYLRAAPAGGTAEGDLKAHISRERGRLVVAAVGAAERHRHGGRGTESWRRRVRRGDVGVSQAGARWARAEGPIVVVAPAERAAWGTACAPGQKKRPHPTLGRPQCGEAMVQGLPCGTGEMEAEREGRKGAADGQPLQSVREGGSWLEQCEVRGGAEAPGQPSDHGLERMELCFQRWAYSRCVAWLG